MRVIRLGMALLLLLNLTGCWSKVELDELTFIYGMFIDKGEERGTVEVSISSPLPNRLMSGTQGGSGAADGRAYSMITKTAATIPEAVILIQKDLSRRLEISHIKIVVVGKEYASQGIGEMLEWFKRQPEVPLGTYIMAAPGRASDIPKLSPIFEQLPDQVLSSISKENLLFGTTIRDCMLSEASHMGYAMNYLSFGQKTDSTEKKDEYWVGVGGVMLFQDMKMRGLMNVNEGRALAWAAGKIAGHITLPVYPIVWDDDGKGAASAIFVRNSAASSVRMTPEGPLFQVKIKGNASITYFKDSGQRDADKLSALLVSKLEQKVAGEVSAALDHTRQEGVDVLHLGMLVEWNYPAEWKKLRERWKDYYTSEARIKVTVKFDIEDFGSEK
ncbi:Ger(x)C family germination protein [Paenibacillus sp. FSL R7-277]|uniref:Ger(x)C family spore germination protein n=1 Tax=Paenibacillus sp. FSL R7-277 TaxID=1227352 RepID=UPI0003E26B06|nr:Ger(x)C family spore germination protein [Paenibacillus sp. FSL R7-277]ETT63102.1 Ger(x)C family germination protein [Paenibacillus sp. FSL R7-277]